MNDRIVVGVDGGGSGSRLLAATNGGKRLVYRSGPPLHALRSDRSQIERALETLFASLTRVDAVAFCIAGARTAASERPFRDWAKRRWPGARVAVHPDIAAVGALTPLDRLAILAGTGSAVGSGIDGSWRFRSGGGMLLGDPGSAFAIGRRALREILLFGWMSRDALPTANRAMPRGDVIEAFSRDPRRFARLGRAILRDLELGSPVAERVVAEEMAELARLAEAFRSGAGLDGPYAASLFGGVFRIGPIAARLLEEALRTGGTGPCESATIERRRPVEGAVRLASHLLRR